MLDNSEGEGDADKFDQDNDYGFGRVITNYSGCLGYLSIFISMINGAILPLFGFYVIKIMFVLIEGPSAPRYYLDRDYWTLFGVSVMGAASLIGFLQKLIFFEVEEQIIFKLRKEIFSELIYKDLTWYDRKPRLLNKLSRLLKDEISKLNGISTEFFGVLMEAIVALGTGLGISFVY